MNVLVAIAAVVAAADLPQRLHLLRGHGQAKRTAVAATTVIVTLAIAAVADPLLDALDISGPNMQIAAGMVLVLWSAVAFVRWSDDTIAVAAGGLVPGFFPVMFTPLYGVVALAVAANNGIVATVVGAVIAAAALVASPSIGRWVTTHHARRASATLGVVTGAVAMTTGVLAI